MPTESVTRRSRNGRAHLVAWRRNGRAMLSPQSHSLAKDVGDTISASWIVTNTGNVIGSGALEFFFPAPGPGFWDKSADIALQPGQRMTFTLSSLLTSPLVPGSYTGELRIVPLAPATVGPGSVHTFTLIIRAPALPVLSPIGEPVIS